MLRIEQALFASMKAEEDGQLPGTFVPLRPPQCCLQWEESSRNWNEKEWEIKKPWFSHTLSGVAKRTAHEVMFNSVAQSCPTLCDPMNHSMAGLPVHHQLPEFTQTHVHGFGDAIQPSHPVSSPSPAPNPSKLMSLGNVYSIRWQRVSTAIIF